ncbi:MAG: hypothetical protein J7J93_00285 [Candidatus Aenigmarchaeota archaeon]|nr:hypothetical protein [Candidatus Aenigmarchaeota archaeon]
MNKEFKQSLIKSWRSIYNLLPVLIGVILLISLVNALIPKAYYSKLFSKNIFLDSIIGSGLGSIMAGNPITSYILGGEFLKQGISLVAVTAFMVAWVTVGIVQLPAESLMLGKKFAIMRNLLSFLFSIMVAIVTVFIVGLI